MRFPDRIFHTTGIKKSALLMMKSPNNIIKSSKFIFFLIFFFYLILFFFECNLVKFDVDFCFIHLSEFHRI